MVETQERELVLKRLNEENKKKLLDNLAQEENKKEAEIMKLQKIRDDERKVLNKRMMQAEQQSDFLIKELMECHSSFSDPSKVMQALEEDKKKMEAQLTVLKEDADKLREKDVLREHFSFLIYTICIFTRDKTMSGEHFTYFLWRVGMDSNTALGSVENEF